MSNRIDIKIFIASSGELNEERIESIVAITELNKNYPHLHLEPILFELDTPSGNFPWKKRIQDGINPLLREAHIVVVLFYSRVGEFTKEELQVALEGQKKVYLFLKQGFVPSNTAEAKKYFQVLELKEKLEEESVVRYQLYTTLKDFNGLFYKELGKYLDKTYPNSVTTPVAKIKQRPLAKTKKTSESLEKELLDWFNFHLSQDDFHSSPNIPFNILTNAKSNCLVPEEEKILALIDLTVFKSGKDCLIFGLRGIYYHNTFMFDENNAHFISYTEFQDRSFSKYWLNISLDNGDYLDCSGCAMNRKDILLILSGVKKIVKNYQ